MNYPTEAGTVRKPLLMSTSSSASNFSGYLFSYRGDVADVQGLSAGIKLDDLLVQNLGSCGAAADLRFGVNIGTNIAGGQQVMRLPFRRPGSVDIGYSGTATTGASLDVKGVIRGGRIEATQGGDILVGRAGSDSTDSTYPTTLNVFGSQFSSANTVIGYGTRPRSGAAGYESSWAGSNISRAALEIGVTGSDYAGLALYTVAQNILPVGTVYTANELFTVNTNGMGYSGGGLTTLTTSGTSALKLSSTSSSSGVGTSSPLWISNPKGTVSLFLGDQSSTSAYTANEYNGNIRFNGAGVAWGDLSYYPKDDSTTGAFRFTTNSATVQSTPNAIVGVGGLIAQTSGITSSGAIRVTSTTDSTSTGSGAVIVSGGLGVAKALYAAGITSTAAIRVTDSTDSTSTLTGALTVTGGLGVGKALYAVGVTSSGAIRVTDSTASTSTLTGALTVTGGLGVAKTIVAAGITSTAGLSVTSGTVSFPTTSLSGDALTASSIALSKMATSVLGVASISSTIDVQAATDATKSLAVGQWTGMKVTNGTTIGVAGHTWFVLFFRNNTDAQIGVWTFTGTISTTTLQSAVGMTASTIYLIACRIA